MGKFNESAILFSRSLRRYISLGFILAAMILIVRLYELIIISVFFGYPDGSLIYLLAGLKFDVIIYLRISAILLLPYLLLAHFNPKLAKNFFVVFSVLLVLIDMLLLKYFSVSKVPLGADLFGYSITEIKHTVQSSGNFNIFPFVAMGLFLAYMIRIFHKHVYYKVKPWFIGVMIILMITSFLPLKWLKAKPSFYNNEFSMFIASNKLNFFGESVANRYLFNEQPADYAYSFPPQISSNTENEFNYIDSKYPFLHNETTPDVLGEYFELNENPPNIVIIIVESLGRAYSGNGAYLGSFTPFTDSLMEKSLYWENCLSTSGRTFQALPSLLASAPFGDHGFAELEENMPDHISLISLLKKEAGYFSTFTYGGEAEFDKMSIFLKRQGIDKIIDSPAFGAGYEKLPATKNGFSWGFGDREIFRRYLQELNSGNENPRLDVLLTVAMHDPFNIPDQDSYILKYKNRMEKLNLTEKTQSFNNTYEKQISTIIYFDESFRFFFNEFRKLPSFANTIFVITGDHRMPEIPISTQLDRFHVPLIIYSPMLKKPEKFSSIVSHFDVTPSLLAMLNNKNIISRPKVAAWIGHGLDNQADFRCLNAYPMMRNKNEILDFVDEEKMLSNDIIYKIYGNMDIEPIQDESQGQVLKARLNDFIKKNQYACFNNKLIPDSLIKYTIIREK